MNRPPTFLEFTVLVILGLVIALVGRTFGWW